MRHKVAHQYADLELLKLAQRRNFCAESQTVTSFPINAGGRTLLIGVDYDASKAADNSLHIEGCNGESLLSDRYSVNSKEALIDAACKSLRKVLEELILTGNSYTLNA